MDVVGGDVISVISACAHSNLAEVARISSGFMPF
jgi:hypothetical protein